MKRLLMIFGLATLLASCTINSVDNNSIQVVNLTASPVDWVAHADPGTGLNLYYSATFNMPEITPNFYAQGSIQAYYVMTGAQQMLPYVRHFEDGLVRWTRTVDFEYSVGSLKVFVTNSDFAIDPPLGMDFRVVMMW